jgi:hypothetical protein
MFSFSSLSTVFEIVKAEAGGAPAAKAAATTIAARRDISAEDPDGATVRMMIPNPESYYGCHNEYQ